MIRNLLVFFLIACLLNCSHQPSVPKGILPVDSMQAVMWNMLQVDELASYRSFSDSSYRSTARHIALYQSVLSAHHLTKDQFKASMQYYQSHPAVLKSIFDSLQKKSDKPANVASTPVDTTKKRKVKVLEPTNHPIHPSMKQ